MTPWLIFNPGTSSMAGITEFTSDWTLRSTLVLIVAAWSTWLLRRRSAALRHFVWTLSIAGVFLLPAFGRIVPGYPMPTIFRSFFAMRNDSASTASRISQVFCVQSEATERVVSRTVPAINGEHYEQSASAKPPPDDVGKVAAFPHRAPVSKSRLDLSGWQFGERLSDWLKGANRWWSIVWLAGVAVMLLPVALGFISLALVKRGSIPFPSALQSQLRECAAGLGIQRPIHAMLSDSRRIPMTWGLIQTCLLLPMDAVTWTPEQFRIVLLHELAHIRRNDFYTQLAGQWMRALLWFNPLAWFALSQLRFEQERASDDMVLNSNVTPDDYALQLLCLTRRQGSRSAWDISLALAMSHYTRLEKRLNAILDETQNRKLFPSSRQPLVVAACSLGLAAISAIGRETPRHDSNEPTRGAARHTAAMTPLIRAQGKAVTVPVTERTSASLEISENPVAFVAQINLSTEDGPAQDLPKPTLVIGRHIERQSDSLETDNDGKTRTENDSTPTEESGLPTKSANPVLTLDQIQTLIQRSSAVTIDQGALTEGAIKGMLSALKDDYSSVITADQLSMIMTGSSSIVGIGVQIEQNALDEKLLIVRAVPNSPAEKAGLKTDDELLAVDDRDVKSLETAVKWIRGIAGTPVKLRLRRSGGDLEDITVVRAVVTTVVEPVVGLYQHPAGEWQYWLDTQEKIGFVQLTQFTGSTATELESVIKRLRSDGLNGLILDLRGNYGGVLPDCVGVASLFVKEGVVVRFQNRSHEDEAISVSGQAPFPDLPLVVLIDGTTTSASEVLAGAFRDHDRAVLVGERTFGKGSLQSIHPLGTTGHAMKLTTAYLLTPGGRTINHTADSKSWGIDPSDGWYVEMKEDDRKARSRHFASRAALPVPLTPELIESIRHDNQLAAAWKALRGKLQTGEFAQTGHSLDELCQQMTRRDELLRQRDELRRKLSLLEQELAQ